MCTYWSALSSSISSPPSSTKLPSAVSWLNCWNLANRLKHTPRTSFPLQNDKPSALTALGTLSKFAAPSRESVNEDEVENKLLATAARWSAIVPVEEAIAIAIAIAITIAACYDLAGWSGIAARLTERSVVWINIWLERGSPQTSSIPQLSDKILTLCYSRKIAISTCQQPCDATPYNSPQLCSSMESLNCKCLFVPP